MTATTSRGGAHQGDQRGQPSDRSPTRGQALSSSTVRGPLSTSAGRRSVSREATAASSVPLPVSDLRSGPSARTRGLDEAHVRTLAEVLDDTPPILVRAGTLEVVDGSHRVAAAQRLGRTTIQSVLCELDERDAFAEHVQANTRHGLALSRKERRRAALELLRGDPQRSDRSIASICGLSPTTVGSVRREALERGDLDAEPATRRGQDGKTYPSDPGTPSAEGSRRRQGAGPLARVIAWLRHLLERLTSPNSGTTNNRPARTSR